MAKQFKSFEEFSFKVKTYRNRAMDKATRVGVDRAMKWTVRYIKKNYFRSRGDPGPGYIVSRSGKLKKSIKATPAKNVKWKGLIFATLKMGGPGMPYAAILEFGGRTRPHIIVPKKKKFLHFIARDGTEVFTKKVQHPGSVFEPRAILGRGMARGAPQVRKFVRIEHNRILKKLFG